MFNLNDSGIPALWSQLWVSRTATLTWAEAGQLRCPTDEIKTSHRHHSNHMLNRLTTTNFQIKVPDGSHKKQLRLLNDFSK